MSQITSMPNVQSLSETKRKLLDRYLREAPSQHTGYSSAIPPRPLGTTVPLALSQEQIVLREELVPQIPPLYNESVTVYRFGSLDVDLLERSFAEVIRRHEIWRTTYHTVNGARFQVVHPAPKHVHLPFIDQRLIPEKERLAETLRLLSEDADGYHCECTCGNLRKHIKSLYHSQKALPTHQLFHDYDFAIVNRFFSAYSA